MNALELLRLVSQKENARRKASIFIDVALILVVMFALWSLTDAERIPAWISLLLFGLFVTIAIPRVGSVISHLRPIRTDDVAEILDRKLLAKEQFLTLANADPKGPIAKYVENRLNEHCSSDSAAHTIANELTCSPPSERRRFWAKLLAALALLVIAMLLRPAHNSETFKKIEQKTILAEELRSLAENSPQASEDLRESLMTIADTVEEHGISAPETIAQIESGIVVADETLAEEIEATPTQQSDPNSPEPKANEEPTPEDSISEQKNDDERKQSETESSDAQQDPLNKSKDQEQPADPKATTTPEKPEQQPKNDADSEQKRSDKDESGTGESKKGDEAKQSDQKTERDPEKSETGTGQGKGKGRSGAQDQAPKDGEKQSGDSSSGAKEGNAKNKSGDSSQQTGEQKPGEKSSDESSDIQKNDGSPKAGASERDGDGNQAIKDRLEKLKEEASAGAKDARTEEKPGEGKQESSKPEQNSGESKKESATEQKDPKKNGPEKNEPTDTPDKSGTDPKKPGEKSSEKKNTDQKSGGDKPEPGKQEQPPPSLEGDRGQGEAPGKEEGSSGKQTPEGNAEKNTPSSEQHTEGDDRNSKNTAARPKTVPNPNEQAPRFGPFDGGNDKSLLDGVKEQTKVEIPQEQNLKIDSLGGADPKLYRNQYGAKTKTTLGSDEFEKPETEAGKREQLIPPEYRDILR